MFLVSRFRWVASVMPQSVNADIIFLVSRGRVSLESVALATNSLSLTNPVERMASTVEEEINPGYVV